MSAQAILAYNTFLGRFSGQVGVPGLEAMVQIAQDTSAADRGSAPRAT